MKSSLQLIICYCHRLFPVRMLTFPAHNVCACAWIKDAMTLSYVTYFPSIFVLAGLNQCLIIENQLAQFHVSALQVS